MTTADIIPAHDLLVYQNTLADSADFRLRVFRTRYTDGCGIFATQRFVFHWEIDRRANHISVASGAAPDGISLDGAIAWGLVRLREWRELGKVNA